IAIEDKAQQGFILRNIGGLYQQLGENALALDNLFQALKIGIATKDIQVQWETEAALGSAYRKQGNREAAIRHYSNAIATYDSVRNNLDIESLKNNFLEDKYQAFPSIVQLLAQQGDIEEAFTFAEKYKAKNLLDILSQGNIFKDLLADTLQLELQKITEQQEEAHRRLSLELEKTNQATTLSLEQQITDLELQQAAILAGLREKHPDYYRLTSPDILTPERIRSNFLDDGQALLEYIVGDARLSVFLMTRDTLLYMQLAAGRDQIEQKLTELSPIFASKNKARGPSEIIVNPQAVDFTIPPAHRLYELLIKPIEPAMNQVTDLIIVPDDLLFYLPFEMLVSDTNGAETRYDFENAEFLLEKYSISYLSSASVLDPGLQRVRTASKGLLAMGNPDFGHRAETLASTELVASKEGEPGRFETDETLPPLPSSEAEVRAIGDVLSGANRIFSGIAATEDNFRKEAGKYRILHLATHFLSNDNQPLYSKIALTQEDKAETDGYLQTYEVFNLDLNADLAVLSACNTGLGKLHKGQGLIGISRAFTFAGVPSLVVSLWNVDDESTSIIMRNFYQNLKDGLNKKQSLRLAKLSYLKSVQASRLDPFYWAPFILLGDASPIQFPKQSSSPLPLILLAAVLGISAFLFLNKRRRLVSGRA
ncbi:MAG: CHAT domain-containing protein, partial [bacterium]